MSECLNVCRYRCWPFSFACGRFLDILGTEKKKKKAYLTKRKNLPTKWWHTITTETI